MTFFRVLLLALFVAATSAEAFAEGQQPAFRVRWGLVLPLSGATARAGVDIRRGFEMAFEDLKDDRIKHEVVIEDSEYTGKSAVSAAQKLISVDKVDVIVALWDTADPVAPLADRYDIIHTSIRWNSNIAEKFKNTFTFESTYKDYSQDFIKLFKKIGVQSFAILNHESQGWNLAMEELTAAAKQHGVEVKSSQSYVPSNSDYRSVAHRAVQGNPDIIIVNDVGEELETITKQVRAFRPKQRVTGYLGYPIDLSLFEGEYFVDQLSTDPQFAARYETQFGEAIYSRAQLAYDLAHIVHKAFAKFESKPSTAQVREALRSISEHHGMSGKIVATNDNKVFRTQTVVMQVQGGKAVPKPLS